MFDSKKDSYITVLKPPQKAAKDKYKSLPQEIKVRFVKVLLKTGEVEVLATNIFDTFTPSKFKELYHLRWGSETYYDVLKNRLNLENFTGRSVESVMQDFFSSIFITGVETIMTEDINSELAAENIRTKFPQKINKAASFNTIKNHVLDLFYTEENIDLLLEKITSLFLSNTTSLRKDRSRTRKKLSPGKLVKFYKHRRKITY